MIRFTLALLLLSISPVYAQPTVLTGAMVYDGTGGAPLADAVVVVQDGRIICVGADCPLPEDAEIVDLSSRYVTPGLVDAHVHFQQTGWFDGRPETGVGLDRYDHDALQRALRADPDRWYRAYLCTGITAVYDVGGYPWSVESMAAAEDDTKRPHVRASGPLVTAHPSIAAHYEVDGENSFYPMGTDEEAIESLERIAAMGSRSVKVWFLDPPEDLGEALREALKARLSLIAREAHSRGLDVIVHATELQNAKAALRAGARMLVHSVWDEPVDDEFLRLARETGATYVPTMTVLGNFARGYASVAFGLVLPIDDPNGCVDAETRGLIAEGPTLRETMPTERADPAYVFDRLERSGRLLERANANLVRVHEAGIPVATGTDAGVPLTFHGPSIYAEMEAMEAAGISPEDVLVMATRNGAAIMDRLDDFGTVEAGKLADLIVLTEDPGASTSAFRSITHVMRGGVLRKIRYFAPQ